MTFLQYKYANHDMLKAQWVSIGELVDFDLFCFNEYKSWMAS